MFKNVLTGALDQFSRLAIPPPPSQPPAPSVAILIRQIASSHDPVDSRAQWKISIHSNDDHFVSVRSLPDPLLPKEEEDLRWYLEEFVPVSPFERSRAREVVERLKAYAETLIREVGLLSPVRDMRGRLGLAEESLVRVMLDIEGDITDTRDSLHRIYWEVLEDVALWPEETIQEVIVRRKVPNVSSEQSVENEGGGFGFNILVLVARNLSKGTAEIGHTVITTEIVKALGELPKGAQVNLEIVRPGTWGSLKKHLESRPKGYFALVHFDMHGRVGEKGASLCFVSERNSRRVVWKPSRDIAALLSEHRIPSVILNACRSADTNGESLALALLAHGVSLVVGMSFKFMTGAACLFIAGFYSSLLVDRSSFATAAHTGRRRLLEQRLRESAFGSKVALKDHIVPVLYQREGVGEVNWERIGKVASRRPRYIAPPGMMVGRELNILMLETILLTESNVLPVCGRPGVGKTTLFIYLGWWWRTTSLIGRFHYFDLAESIQSFDYVLARFYVFIFGWPGLSRILELVESRTPRLSRIYNEILTYLRDNRHLLVIDGLEKWKPEASTLALEPMEYRHIQRQLMKEFLEDLKGGRSFVMVTAGVNNPWIDCPYNISGIDGYYMRDLVPIDPELLKPETDDAPDAEFFEYYGKIIDLLDGVPGALSEFSNVLPLNKGSSHPKTIYLAMISNVPSMCPYRTVDKCYRLVVELQGLNKGSERDSDAFTLLLSLAPFQIRVPIDMRAYLACLVVNGAFLGSYDAKITSGTEIEEAKTQLAPSTLLAEYTLLTQRLKQLDLLTPDKFRPDLYYRINPILTLALRRILLRPGPLMDLVASCKIPAAFSSYHTLQWEETVPDHGVHSRTQLEKTNIFSAMETLLLGLEMETSLTIPRTLEIINSIPLVLYIQLLIEDPILSLELDKFIIEHISKQAIASFDRLRTENPSMALEPSMGLYLLAYTSSVYLTTMYNTQRPFHEFSLQHEKCEEYSELGRTLSETLRQVIRGLDFSTAMLAAEVARLRPIGDGVIPTFGKKCEGNMAALEVYRTDPRIAASAADDEASGVGVTKRLQRLNIERHMQGSQTPAEEKLATQMAIESCCNEIRGSAIKMGINPKFVDGWLAPYETRTASHTIISDGVLITRTAEYMPGFRLHEAISKVEAGDIPHVKKVVLAELKDLQDTSPENEYICLSGLSLINYNTGQWADAIAYTMELLQILDVVEESAAHRQLVKASLHGQNALSHVHLRQWDQALDDALVVLRICRQHRGEGYLQLRYDVLILIKYIGCISGGKAFMSAGETKRERYQVLQICGKAVDSEQKKKDEEMVSLLRLISMMYPQFQMALLQEYYFSDIPTFDGFPLFTKTVNEMKWQGGEDDEKFAVDLKEYVAFVFSDPESAWFGSDVEEFFKGVT